MSSIGLLQVDVDAVCFRRLRARNMRVFTIPINKIRQEENMKEVPYNRIGLAWNVVVPTSHCWDP